MNHIQIQQETQDAILFTHTFELNETCEWLALQAVHPNLKWLQILVKDSQGKLRMQYLGKGDAQTILLGQDGLSSSYGSVPGELPQGLWSIQVLAVIGGAVPFYTIDIYSGMGQSTIEGTLPVIGEELWTHTESDCLTMDYAAYDWNRVHSTVPRWYKGDFHMHTLLSDGKQTTQQLNAQAISQGLDFIVITEHNILTTGWPKSDLLVIPGVEITSSKGHFNALGIREWIDLMGSSALPELETPSGMERILSEARMQGAVCSLNHPLLAPWDWQLDVSLDLFETLEIWNDPTFPDNERATEQALLLWDYLWANGLTIWGIGGSDTHNLPHESYTPGGLPSLAGDPKTVIWSHELSVAAVLQAVRSGRSYVTRGPIMQPKVVHQAQQFLPGDCILWESDSDELHLNYEIAIQGAHAGSSIRWIMNGKEIEQTDCAVDKTYLLPFTWKRNEFNWIRVEIRDISGQLLAFVNPVFQGQPAPALKRWSDIKSWLDQL